ncbi:MAG: ATP-binding protein [Terriglobia bacterium]|jgi:two-component system sensor histidine kinase PilS (NtrC family)|nr:ATP-binding protein [Terriglobia bacterium]
MATTFNERTWLEWLVKVRVIIITFLLAIELAITTLTATSVSKSLFIAVIIAWYVASAIYMVWLRSGRNVATQARAQVLTDLAFATAVVYVTGGIDTSFNFLFPLVIILASILLSQSWAYLTAALSFIFFGAILELSFFELIPSFSASKPDLKSLQAVIFINLFAYVVVAYLAGRLSNRLRQVGVELRNKQDALEDLQVLQANIVNSISGGVITTDLEGHVKLINPAGCGLLGLNPETVQGRQVQELFIDPLPSETSGFWRREVRAIATGGEEKTFAVTVAGLRLAGRGLVGQVYTFDDLTEIRRLEQEIRMRDRLAAVGRLAAGIAHEIRNPLSSIAGSVKVLSGIATLSDDQRKLVEIVTRESDRLNAIITDFLDYSREKKFQMRVVDLVALLQDTLTLLENRPPVPMPWRPETHNKEIEIRRVFNVEHAWAYGDIDKLKQVFWNIADNGLRAMPSGGVLTVTVSEDGDGWRVSFRDTGIGISHRHLEKIFEPFQSEFEGGTGLGLAIVYQIVQAHDADIEVKSGQGKGTEILLRFSRAENAIEARAKADGLVRAGN